MREHLGEMGNKQKVIFWTRATANMENVAFLTEII